MKKIVWFITSMVSLFALSTLVFGNDILSSWQENIVPDPAIDMILDQINSEPDLNESIDGDSVNTSLNNQEEFTNGVLSPSDDVLTWSTGLETTSGSLDGLSWVELSTGGDIWSWVSLLNTDTLSWTNEDTNELDTTNSIIVYIAQYLPVKEIDDDLLGHLTLEQRSVLNLLYR